MHLEDKLINYYLPPDEGFILESLVATTYEIDFEFLEEELLATSLGVRSPVSRWKGFRSELERKLQAADVTIFYDPGGCDKLTRMSPRIDIIPVITRKLHAKISIILWVKQAIKESKSPEYFIRLIIGSANLTRKGFRENYECAVAIDYSRKQSGSRWVLNEAIEIIRELAKGSTSTLLDRQLMAVESRLKRMPKQRESKIGPVAFVTADQVVPQLKWAWSKISRKAPERMIIVSPFWPVGDRAASVVANLVNNFGSPGRVELVCQGASDIATGKWIPRFDSDLAYGVCNLLHSRLYIRPAKPDFGIDEGMGRPDPTIDTEDSTISDRKIGTNGLGFLQRKLHAKMIILECVNGAVIYIGSSNCTRRGLSLGGPTNWEAGLIFHYPKGSNQIVEKMMAFAGDAIEVQENDRISMEKPTEDPERFFPRFIFEVVASESKIVIYFREGMQIPEDLVVLMRVTDSSERNKYWLLIDNDARDKIMSDKYETDLHECHICDESLEHLEDEVITKYIPDLLIEIRWDDHNAEFPVRFDDKASLPLLLQSRRYTEDELLDYFKTGYDPNSDSGGTDLGWGDDEQNTDKSNEYGQVDTRKILSYHIRRFIQALPGIETELHHAAYSKPALEAALRGPTSPLELANRIYLSLTEARGPDEPKRTPVAIVFQLVELLASLSRCKKQIKDTELKQCFDPVINHCHDLIAEVREQAIESEDDLFKTYIETFAGRLN